MCGGDELLDLDGWSAFLASVEGAAFRIGAGVGGVRGISRSMTIYVRGVRSW
jgi:hypothetical protein